MADERRIRMFVDDHAGHGPGSFKRRESLELGVRDLIAAVREETQADWRREKQVLVNRCTVLEEQVAAVRREERERCAAIADHAAECMWPHDTPASIAAAIREQGDE